jgi:hypothetical protein
MCLDCDDDEERSSPLRVTEYLIRLTRQIEEDMPGTPVTEEAWPVFFGRQGGSIAWKDYERMARCREGALVIMSMSDGSCPNGAGEAQPRMPA